MSMKLRELNPTTCQSRGLVMRKQSQGEKREIELRLENKRETLLEKQSVFEL